MYVLLSPAKKLHEPPAVPGVAHTEPELLDDAERLARTMRNKSQKLMRTMNVGGNA